VRRSECGGRWFALRRRTQRPGAAWRDGERLRFAVLEGMDRPALGRGREAAEPVLVLLAILS